MTPPVAGFLKMPPLCFDYLECSPLVRQAHHK
jgi:hypothetical protein